MGLNCSTLSDLEGNEYLLKFTGTEPLSPNDPVWNKLFSHSLRPVFTKDESFLLDNALENLKNSLVTNNPSTRNLSALIIVFISRANELAESVSTGDTMFMWQAFNALFMIRNACKYFIETLDEEGFAKQFQTGVERVNDEATAAESNGNANANINGVEDVEDGSGNPPSAGEDGGDDVLELLIESLVKLVVELPLQNNTYLIHLEAVNTLIILLSAQMFWAKPAYKLSPFKVMMVGGATLNSSNLTKVLMNNYIQQMNPPYSILNPDDSGSIVIGVASGIWNMLKKGVGLNKPDETLESLKQHNLANQSLYLLLVLINHCTSGSGNIPNPYREAAVTFGNESVGDESLNPEEPVFKLSYCKLYETICEHINCDESTLLLYFLLHRNIAFKSYVMARSDIELLVLPILKVLYNAPTSTSYHIYMSLIVMLILSEDPLFNQQVHDITLKNVVWYTERKINDITLGGLIILVIIRTIQYNILKMRDKYLHTNCLAALANMSSKFRSLHPYVAQRLISVFETLAKRHAKLIENLESQTSNGSVSKKESEEATEIVQDINVLEEVIRMLLEILNSVFTYQLPQNRHLVYTLLYKKDVFEAFREYETTQDLVFNLDIVIKFFTKRIGPDSSELAVSQVMQRIEEGVRHWSPDILRKFPDLKFRYVEEDQPENFFIPYVWSLVYRNVGLYWSPLNLSLFSADGDYT